MGAGVLPIAKHKKKLYFLFSREWIHSDCDPGLWSDFGGTRKIRKLIKKRPYVNVLKNQWVL